MIVGVVPAAGLATRLQPIPCSKEVLPVGGRPAIDHVVERMREGGAEAIRVVTRPEKRDVADRSRELGATVVEATPANVCESLLTGLAGVEESDVVLFGFPDTIWDPVDGYRPLVDAVTAGAVVALGLFRGREPERSDVVELDGSGRVVGIDVKPSRPRSPWIWGCGAARAGALAGLAGHAEPGVYFDELARVGAVAGIRLAGEFTDIGTREALERLTGRPAPRTAPSARRADGR